MSRPAVQTDRMRISGLRGSTRRSIAAAGAALAIAAHAGCSPGTGRLDEAPIYEGNGFRLKLVRYFEDLPLHYTGAVFRVQCSSAQTRNSPAHDTQEAGWVSLGNGSAGDSEAAAELAARERHRYLVVDDHTLVWIGNGVNVSFDACGSFHGWHPTALPENLIIPAPKPDYCRPVGKVECRQYDFLGERAPQFEDILVNPDGHISFVVRSPALRNGGAMQVRSVDFGKSWLAQALDPRTVP